MEAINTKLINYYPHLKQLKLTKPNTLSHLIVFAILMLLTAVLAGLVVYWNGYLFSGLGVSIFILVLSFRYLMSAFRVKHTFFDFGLGKLVITDLIGRRSVYKLKKRQVSAKMLERTIHDRCFVYVVLDMDGDSFVILETVKGGEDGFERVVELINSSAGENEKPTPAEALERDYDLV
ncbi:hypothetical protein GCM10011297_20730 [Bacterioplanes sanyensis]|uniref:hypothetical protein n=1 Tax=Bacterioplanes sanyensis TaxID=1249553 RepID=UPI00167658C1|nr:hypothetical protein [Bacterioplanes sanyensis]GGY47748.1 hypothetical protein GCM10011297_20730 [Bacterioplanes sanyensis]